MKIAVVGAGAVGGTLAALLSRAGEDVTAVVRAPWVAPIRRRGLEIEEGDGRFVARVEAVARLRKPPDLALLTVKTQDVAEALRTHRRALGGATVVTFQNGVRSDAIAAAALPPQRIVSGIISGLTATNLEPGRIRLLKRGWLVVGRPQGDADETVRGVARLLARVVPTRTTDNTRGAHWFKLLVNLNNALPALTGAPMGEILARPGVARLSVGLMREGFRTVRRAGIPLEGLPGFPPLVLFRWVQHAPIPLVARMVRRQARAYGAGGPVLGSTLQSLLRGRPTEIDSLNGEVVRLGREVGLPTPLNERVTDLVHEVERTGTFLSAEELCRRASGGA